MFVITVIMHGYVIMLTLRDYCDFYIHITVLYYWGKIVIARTIYFEFCCKDQL